MMNLQKNWALIILLLSIIAILSALIAQYIYFIQPCKLCIYQRYPYYFLILISCFFLLLKEQNNKIYFLIIEVIFAIGLFFSIWHVAIENNLISDIIGCSASIENIDNVSELKKSIINKPLVMCNDINWSFLGISFAIYNSLLQFGLLIINSIFLVKKKI